MHALVAVDLDAEEAEVQDEALAWLERVAASVAVVHVGRDRTRQARLAALLGRLPADRRGEARIVDPGSRDAADVFVALAPGHDLLVVGTHGRRGLGRMVLGSFAERVVGTSPLPVLVLRRAANAPAPPAPILAAVDLDHGADDVAAEAVRWGYALRSRVDAIHVDRSAAGDDRALLASGGGLVGHVVTVDRTARDRLDAWTARLPAELRGTTRVVDEGDAARAILAAAPGHAMVLVGTRGRRATAPWLGSVAERVVRLADVPVLVAPVEERQGR